MSPDRTCITYYCILRTLNLLGQAHKKNIWTVLDPVIIQLFFRLSTDSVIGCGQRAQQLGQRGVNLGWEQRHVDRSSRRIDNSAVDRLYPVSERRLVCVSSAEAGLVDRDCNPFSWLLLFFFSLAGVGQ